MKKFIIASFAFVLLLTGATKALASGPFNGQSGDCPSIAIGNYNTGVGIGDGQWNCWTRTSVSATEGQTINVALFYHNNTNSTLTNVEASLSQSSTGPSTHYSFTGNMYSDQGNTPLGTVTLSLNSSQTLTYSSAHWMKDKYAIDSDTDSTMLYGQDGSVMKNGGRLRIGSVPSGWTDYGYIIVVFKVGNQQTQQVCKDPSALNYNVSYPCEYNNPNPVNYCKISYFNVDDTSVEYGDTVRLSWSTSNCNSVNISGIGSVASSGSRNVTMYGDRDFLMNAYGNYGSDSRSVYVNVDNNDNGNTCHITNFDADDTSIEEGDSTVLRWSTENCNSVSISNIGSVSRNGSQRVEPNYTRTYTLKAYGNNGSDSDSVKIYVDENNNDDDNYDYNTPSAKTYSPKNVDTNSATLSGYVSGNGSRINSWFEFPCYGTKYGQKYNQTSGNITANVYSLSSNRTYSYCAVAQNVSTGKTVRGNTVSFTTEGGYVAPINNCAVTTVATNIGQTNAQLNGLITGGNGGNSYFEYGTSVNLGQRTTSRYVNGNVNFNEFVSGLSSNTIYYFRMVSDCGDGLSYGSTEVFRTDTIQTVGTTTKTVYIKQGTTVVGEKSPVLLTISNKYKMIAAGDLVDYVVTYKNIGNATLLKPMVQVVLPTNMTLVNSSRGTYSIDTHTLSAQVEDLAPGQEGAIYLQAKVDSIPLNNSNIPTTAIFIYTSTTGSQENAMAYVVNNPLVDTSGTVVVDDTNSTLGGAALFGSMGSIGLVGWLIIILIILVLILIVRSVYDRNPSGPTPHGPAH